MAKQKRNVASLLDNENNDTNLTTSSNNSVSLFDTLEAVANETLSIEERTARAIRHEGAFRYIPLKSGRRVRFETIYIPYEKIADATVIHPCNTRNPATVTLESCSDIAPSISADGVMLDALATKKDNGPYEIFEGQRRRFCAIAYKKGLPLSYTSEVLTPAEAREISHVANLAKPNSFWEKGNFYLSEMERLGLTEISDYADHSGLGISHIHYSIKAAGIPIEVYGLYPNSTDLSRTKIIAIDNCLKLLDQKQSSQLISRCAEAGVQSTEGEAYKLLVATIAEITGSTSAPSPADITVGDLKVKQKSKGKVEVALPKGMTFEDFVRVLQAAIRE